VVRADERNLLPAYLASHGLSSRIRSMSPVREVGRARPASLVEPGTYLTDGVRLLRVIVGFEWPPEESWAVLEDCRTLEQATYTPDELWRMGLERVTG
jgi:hypothetical protein